jgi:hypothetical protein
VARAFGLPPLEGSVEALFPEVRLDATTQDAEGGGEMGLFGGTVQPQRDLRGGTSSRRFPKLQLSAPSRGSTWGG